MTDQAKVTVKEHERKRPHRRGDRQKVTEAKADAGKGMVQIMGGGPSQGVSVESKSIGGSLETTVELSTDQNDRALDGRRNFQNA